VRWVLGLESSCDETSAAVLDCSGPRPRLVGLCIRSQDVHALFGGVVPEFASRAHLTTIGPVVAAALQEAGIALRDVDGIAVTHAPGLVGALLVGVMYGKTLAWSLDRPLLGVHHLEGHLFAPTLEDPDLEPPFTALLVSGGHTMLLDVEAWGRYRLLGQTIDDAAGEAFDKTAKLLGLGYPGGAAIERLAASGDPTRFVFPRSFLHEVNHDDSAHRWHFSFSGLKTAVLRAVQRSPDLDADRAHLARGFQDAVIDVLVAKTARAAEVYGRRTVVLGGGVACNRTLAERMRARLGTRARVSVASPRLNTDNAAMIAAAGAWRLRQGERSDLSLEPRDARPLPGLVADPAGVPA
jgi:N6-L-threonylcarbamoyladenine synthase